jgi:tape measure domain-containing protein
MSITVEELVTIYRMNPSSYVSGASAVRQATQGVGAAITRTVGLVSAFTGLVGGAGLVGLGTQAMKTAANLEGLKLGLTAMVGSTAAAEREFSKLREVAKLPGLGLQEAVQGATRLMAAGLSANQARAALLGFGNALATVGGGKDQLDGVILALSQIASKGHVSAEEINQIAERVPQIRKIMQGAFGTADTEALQKMGIGPKEFIGKIVAELAKLPKVTGGSKNAFENLQDTGVIALAAIGDVLNKAAIPSIDALSAKVQKLADTGGLTRLASAFTSLIDPKGVDGAVDAVISAIEKIPAWIGEHKEEIVGTFRTIVSAIAALRPVVETAGKVLLAMLTAFNSLPDPIKTTAVAVVILSRATDGLAISIGVRLLGAVARLAAVGFERILFSWSAACVSGGNALTVLQSGLAGLATPLVATVALVAALAVEIGLIVSAVYNLRSKAKELEDATARAEGSRQDLAPWDYVRTKHEQGDKRSSQELYDEFMNSPTGKRYVAGIDKRHRGAATQAAASAKSEQSDSATPGTAANYLRQIADRTAKMVDLQERHNDFQRQVLGGGNRMADFSNADIAGLAAAGSRGRSTKLAVVIDDLIQRAAVDLMRRQGRLSVR